MHVKVDRSIIEVVHTCMYGTQFWSLVDRHVFFGLQQHGAFRAAVFFGTDTENNEKLRAHGLR